MVLLLVLVVVVLVVVIVVVVVVVVVLGVRALTSSTMAFPVKTWILFAPGVTGSEETRILIFDFFKTAAAGAMSVVMAASSNFLDSRGQHVVVAEVVIVNSISTGSEK